MVLSKKQKVDNSSFRDVGRFSSLSVFFLQIGKKKKSVKYPVKDVKPS